MGLGRMEHRTHSPFALVEARAIAYGLPGWEVVTHCGRLRGHQSLYHLSVRQNELSALHFTPPGRARTLGGGESLKSLRAKTLRIEHSSTHTEAWNLPRRARLRV